MNTTQAQIKVNIPLMMKDFLESKASKFGMPVAGYIKHLILKDIEDMDCQLQHERIDYKRRYASSFIDCSTIWRRRYSG